MKRINSAALGLMNRTLGLEGPGSGATELHDGQVFQTINIESVARRSRTLAGSQGIFTGVLRVINPGAGELFTSVSPYNVGGSAIPPYPEMIGPEFDIWLMSAMIQRTAGAAATDALLIIQYSSVGFGEDNLGAAVVLNLDQVVAHWDALVTVGSKDMMVLAGSDQPEAIINRRIPRHTPITNASIVFVSDAAAAGTWDMQLVFGIYPVATGQDGAV